MNAALQFVKGVFSDGDTPSFSRTASGAVVGCGLVWISYLVFHEHKMPDLVNVGQWVIEMVGVLYGTNRITTTLQSIGNKS